MSPFWGNLAGVITTLLLATFVSIWIWAWSGRHRRTFDALARVPMQDTEDRR